MGRLAGQRARKSVASRPETWPDRGTSDVPVAVGTSALATARCLLLDRFALDVVDALRTHGVESLLLKGPSIAAWLWPGELRLYGDVDLLVSPAAHGAVEQILSDMGLADRRPPSKRPSEPETSRPWSKADGGLVVDLHQGLVGVNVDNATTWQVLWEHREPLTIGGGELLALDEPGRALHVVLHAVQHNRQDKPLRDLQRALEVVPTEVWRQATLLSVRLDAIDAFGGGLLLLPGGRELAQQLELEPRLSVHLALRVASPQTIAHGFERMAASRGLAGKVGFVFDRLTPAPNMLRHWSPLARRGRAGLALAYLWRILSLVGRAPPGFIQWRRARHAASTDLHAADIEHGHRQWSLHRRGR